MPDTRDVPSGSTPEQVLASEIARLSRELATLQATVLRRTSGLAPYTAGAPSFVVLTDSGGARWKVGVNTSGTPISLGPA